MRKCVCVRGPAERRMEEPSSKSYRMQGPKNMSPVPGEREQQPGSVMRVWSGHYPAGPQWCRLCTGNTATIDLSQFTKHTLRRVSHPAKSRHAGFG